MKTIRGNPQVTARYAILSRANHFLEKILSLPMQTGQLAMHYAVSGQLLSNKSTEFLQLLTDGTIASQKPDGKEIVASMQRAVVDQDGIVRWSEVCYCPTPLQHERATVYDHFFTNLETCLIDDYQEFTGQPFMAFLQEQPS